MSMTEETSADNILISVHKCSKSDRPGLNTLSESRKMSYYDCLALSQLQILELILKPW
jgi:hypothetical protein